MSLIDKDKMQDSNYPKDAWELMSPRLTDKRRERMLQVAAHRTDYVRLMVQDIHDPHNISACLRSAEAFGVLNIDVINQYQRFRASTVSKGSANWLNVTKWPTIKECAVSLKEQGYKIAAGYPTTDNLSLFDIPVDKPVALLFGNEHRGIDPEWLEHVDYKFTIPMMGMVESLNISVSAALSMLEITRKARKTLGDERYYLSEEARNNLLGSWVCRESRDYEKELSILREKAKSK